MMIAPPMNVPCQNALIPSRPRLLRMISSRAEPTRAPIRRAGTAHEAGAADHRRGDDLQFHAGTDIGRHRAEPARLHDPRNRRGDRGQDVDGNFDAAHRNTGQRRGVLVAADGEDVAAEARPAQHEARREGEHEHIEDGIGDAEGTPPPERQQPLMVGPELEHDGVVGHHHRETAGDREHAQRHDERWKSHEGDQHPVERAHGHAGGERNEDPDLEAVACVHRDRERHACKTQAPNPRSDRCRR